MRLTVTMMTGAKVNDRAKQKVKKQRENSGKGINLSHKIRKFLIFVIFAGE